MFFVAKRTTVGYYGNASQDMRLSVSCSLSRPMPTYLSIRETTLLAEESPPAWKKNNKTVFFPFNKSYLWCDAVQWVFCLPAKLAEVVGSQLKPKIKKYIQSQSGFSSSPPVCRQGGGWSRRRSWAPCRTWCTGSSRSCSRRAPC